MKQITYYPREILEYFHGKLTAVSTNVFVGERPVAFPVKMDDLVVVSLPYGFQDHHVTQTGLVRFELIARNKQNGVENIERLDSMMQSLLGLLPARTARFFAHDPRLSLKGGDGAGFTVWCIHARLEINTMDRFT